MVVFGFGLLGCVTGLYHPAGLKMVSHSANISRYMGYHGISGSLGLAIGPIYGSWIASSIGWRFSYLYLSILSLFAYPRILIS